MDEPTDDRASDAHDPTDGDNTTDTGETTADPLRTVIETVTPPYVSRRDVEMDALAWGGVALVVVVLFPFLPILVAGWGILKLIELLADRR